ncbi:MAG TPA: hypothetical protein VMV29_12170 [Ktedonobacterales bacterium]|nr:hypothetical protein [Ktedonobacterales bacterium]
MANELNAVIQMGGRFLKHAVGILLLCWRRMLRAGLVAALVAIVLGEVVAMTMTHSLNPGGPAQFAVAALAIALAYGAALTVLVEEFIWGVVETLRLLEGDVAAGARASSVLAEREIGQVHIGLKHLFGLAAPVAWVDTRVKAAREAADARQEQRDRAEATATQRRAQEAAVAQRRAAQEQSRRDQLATQTRQRQAAQERERQDRLAEQARVRNERLAQQQRQQRERAAEASAAALAAGAGTAIAAAALGAQATHGQRHTADTPPFPAQHDQPEDHAEVSVASVTQLPPVSMQPVLASNLPRIEWTYDQHDPVPSPEQIAQISNVPAANTPVDATASVFAAPAAPTDDAANPGANQPDDAPDEPLAPARFVAPTDETDDAPEPPLGEDTVSAPNPTEAPPTTGARAIEPAATSASVIAAPASGADDEANQRAQPGAADDVTAPAQRPAAWVAPVIAGAAASAAVAGVATGLGDRANHANHVGPDALDATTQPAQPTRTTRPLPTAPLADATPTAADATSVGSNGVHSPVGADATRKRATQPLSANTRPLSANTQPLGAITRPLGAVTRPLPAQTRPLPASSSGLWERISQALVGRTPASTRPVAPTESGSADEAAEDPFGEMTPLPPMPAADEDQV